jgi:hypothetical protein
MKRIVLAIAAVASAALLAVFTIFPSHSVAQEGLACQTPVIVVSSTMPTPQSDGSTGGVDLACGAQYAWNAFIAMNWPAKAGARGMPDTQQPFGQGVPTVWETMRAKDELYPGNASATVGPHGAAINPVTHKATNPPDFGFGDPAEYFYSPSAVKTPDGRAMACKGQSAVANAALIPLDETTEIGNNQTFAGAAPATDPTGYNTKPQLIRYAVKMNENIYVSVVNGQYWYSGTGTPLDQSEQNYVAALAKGQNANPPAPYVNFAPPPPSQSQPQFQTGIEVKSAWRPLSAAEASSGRFFKTTVRYFEEDAAGTPCYREAVWGLVGMHLITFTPTAPWVIWSTFEQADNILSANGKPVEDANGAVIPNPKQVVVPPTSPTLSSDPLQVAPTVKAAGPYCAKLGARLYFHENPTYGTLPSAGNICVNTRWHPIPSGIITVNTAAHKAISAYLAKSGGRSPWLYYKLVNVQATPVDVTAINNPRFSTPQSYLMANSVIETDYSLGQFTGDLVNGVPSNVVQNGTVISPYYNNTLLPFQAGNLSTLEKPLRMGGCAGCHGFAASEGQDSSFALGNDVVKPESTDAFRPGKLFREYFPVSLKAH